MTSSRAGVASNPMWFSAQTALTRTTQRSLARAAVSIGTHDGGKRKDQKICVSALAASGPSPGSRRRATGSNCSGPRV